GDECTPLIIDFIEQIAPNLKDRFVILDTKGGSRCGFLCADMNAPERFQTIFNEKITGTINEKTEVTALVDNIINNNKNKIKNLTVHSLLKRLDMLDYALKIIKDLTDKGVKPSEISVITPVQDKMLKFCLSEVLINCNPVFISGNEKLNDNPLVKAIITILKLSDNKPVDEYDLRVILSKYLSIPIKNCRHIFEEFRKTGNLKPPDLGYHTDKYKKFCNILEKLKSSKSSLSEKAYYIYTTLVNYVDRTELTKFNFFLKELQDFEKAFGDIEDEIIIGTENSIISENPYSSLETGEQDLIISTPQKIIDNKIQTKYQIWLDTSSLEWIKSDIGPLYNSWVFQKGWNKKEYTVEDNIELTKQKTAKILRKLMNNTDKIFALSSLFDTQGAENFGGIEKYLISDTAPAKKTAKKVSRIIPRKDQKPVLEYKSGKMAVSAVPGAGKTTVLLALIIKLLDRGINPENIYVLTYMESAARNFKDKIKNINPDSSKLPNISTIHGLALRILKENSNFERIGLNSDFEICDDTQRGQIIRILSKNLNKTDAEDFDRAISVLKLSPAELNPDYNDTISNLLNLKKGSYSDMKLSRFLKFYYNYQELLRQNNLIDYDDILTYSVKLLEENLDILQYYQNICGYIIEDEAQDSSSIQQKLINLLGEKHGNIIRCGDINQAITTTFTNADTEGFKEFINTSYRVDMNCSQRCSEGVRQLANSIVKYGNAKLKEPFYEIYMHPVDGKNPSEKNSIYSNIYKNGIEEKTETIKTIKNILKQKPDSSIGILLRNNYQVNNWASYINNSGLNVITRNECLAQKTIFRVIFSILKFISSPFDNLLNAQAYRALSECGIFKLHLDKVIENFETDFISQDNDDIADSDLSRFHWDMNYWLSFAELGIDELVLKIGMYYFSSDIEKSNIYLIST
ncbi:MAG: UvrD-helicase domain-containing protein, partial [Candidatus Gastranaerophilales bacterium]|nr:UvrD-helicase domain-containing protein [Candidatus Gastranaerophilales bacterium]